MFKVCLIAGYVSDVFKKFLQLSNRNRSALTVKWPRIISQNAHEGTLSSISHQRNTSQTHKTPPHTCEDGPPKRGPEGGTGALVHGWDK